MINLTNGAIPVQWEIGQGGNGLRRFVGKCICTGPIGNHRFVVWYMASDDGVNFDCHTGHYTDDIDDAVAVYDSRRVGYNRAQVVITATVSEDSEPIVLEEFQRVMRMGK